MARGSYAQNSNKKFVKKKFMSKKKKNAINFFKMGRSLITEKKLYTSQSGIVTLAGSSAVGSKTSWKAQTNVLYGIVQGSDKNQRIGDKIFVRYAKWYIEITNNGVDNPDWPFVRIGVLTPRGDKIVDGDFDED